MQYPRHDDQRNKDVQQWGVTKMLSDQTMKEHGDTKYRREELTHTTDPYSCGWAYPGASSRLL
jgi:hypothetical protein